MIGSPDISAIKYWFSFQTKFNKKPKMDWRTANAQKHEKAKNKNTFRTQTPISHSGSGSYKTAETGGISCRFVTFLSPCYFYGFRVCETLILFLQKTNNK
jgi:hypothetical protein